MLHRLPPLLLLPFLQALCLPPPPAAVAAAVAVVAAVVAAAVAAPVAAPVVAVVSWRVVAVASCA